MVSRSWSQYTNSESLSHMLDYMITIQHKMLGSNVKKNWNHDGHASYPMRTHFKVPFCQSFKRNDKKPSGLKLDTQRMTSSQKTRERPQKTAWRQKKLCSKTYHQIILITTNFKLLMQLWWAFFHSLPTFSNSSTSLMKNKLTKWFTSYRAQSKEQILKYCTYLKRLLLQTMNSVSLICEASDLA